MGALVKAALNRMAKQTRISHGKNLLALIRLSFYRKQPGFARGGLKFVGLYNETPGKALETCGAGTE